VKAEMMWKFERKYMEDWKLKFERKYTEDFGHDV